jgi:hypothetical protein
MNQSRSWLGRAKNLCAEFGPEDGIDPRQLSKRYLTDKPSHKANQLCKVAQRVLSLVLGEFNDPLLQSLSVVEVTSLSQGSSLLVTLSYPGVGLPEQEHLIMQSLHAVEGALRAAVARSVKRRRIAALKIKLHPLGEKEACDANSQDNQ